MTCFTQIVTIPPTQDKVPTNVGLPPEEVLSTGGWDPPQNQHSKGGPRVIAGKGQKESVFHSLFSDREIMAPITQSNRISPNRKYFLFQNNTDSMQAKGY